MHVIDLIVTGYRLIVKGSAIGIFLLVPLAGCQTGGPGGGGGVEDVREQGIAADTNRLALQSQCGQAVIECTTAWPTPVIVVQARDGQTVTNTEGGFLVQGSDGNAQELIQLIGSNSTLGNGATQISFSWSTGAADDDPCTLAAGTEFSADADPQVLLEEGFHYIRLTVQNDVIQATLVLEGCDTTLENVPSSDFVEVEVEVRD